MKRIGILGGMSWESTQSYYRILNEEVRRRLGALHSAEILLYSVDFEPIERLQHRGEWDAAAQILLEDARSLERAGADFLLLATNTMHKIAPTLEKHLHIELLHIADAVGQALRHDGISRVGLLGTAFTMEEDFYRRRLEERYDLEVLIPEGEDRSHVHRVIYDELCLGITRDESRQRYLRIIDKLRERGAEAVILGCTEIGLLLDGTPASLPLYDSTEVHALAAVERALR